MKKNLSLILAIVLVLSSLACLTVVGGAAEETVAPSQEIEYFNLSLKTNSRLLFAVPAEGYAVKTDGTVDNLNLLVWEEGKSNGLYSESDAAKNGTILEASGAEMINGKKYVVFSYDGLSASEMTKTVYVRTLVTAKDGSHSYSEVYDYSVTEFAMRYSGTKSDLVDLMLAYGDACEAHFAKTPAQTYKASEAKSLVPITVVTKLGGVELSTQITQLAKVGETVTLRAPHVDGATLTSWGEGVTDGKITVSGPVTVVANYDYKSDFLNVDFENDTVGAIKDNLNSTFMLNGEKYTPNGIGDGYFTLGSKPDAQRVPHEYHGYEIVADPNNPENTCLKFAHTGSGEIKLAGSVASFANTGIGDTVGFTLEFDITASPNGTLPESEFRIDRTGTAASGTGGTSPMLLKLLENGEIRLGNAEGPVLAVASATKATRISVFFDASANRLYGYVDGVLTATRDNVFFGTSMKDALDAIANGNNTRFRVSIYGGYLGANWTTKPIPAELIENGVFTFTETDTYVTNGSGSQVYVKSGDTYVYSKSQPTEGTAMYIATVDYVKYAEYLTANESFYLDNIVVAYGEQVTPAN